jgi:hypothetical protein
MTPIPSAALPATFHYARPPPVSFDQTMHRQVAVQQRRRKIEQTAGYGERLDRFRPTPIKLRKKVATLLVAELPMKGSART